MMITSPVQVRSVDVEPPIAILVYNTGGEIMLNIIKTSLTLSIFTFLFIRRALK